MPAALLAGLTALALAGSAAPAAGPPLPPVPTGWPSSRLELGLADQPGGAVALRKSIPMRFRYQYLAGGANTGEGWATWNERGTFVTRYIRESRAAGLVPVFSYYMIRQSAPGREIGDEADADLTNLANAATRSALLADLEVFFRRAGAERPARVVLQVEPDLWGHVQQRARNDDAATVPFARAFAQRIVRLRNQHAPNVLLAYPVAIWGTKIDISYSDPADAIVDGLAARSARFYRSLGARFDLAFAEFADRDSEFKVRVQGIESRHAWWRSHDFRRHARFLGVFSRGAGLRVVLWQIPLGNTRMRAVDNSWGHFQDNRVEWLLDDPGRSHLRAYASAGVIAFLFGGGAAGTTCACDAAKDGVTNPAPVGGNVRPSLSADDDGGFFRDRARAYYRRGAIAVASR